MYYTLHIKNIVYIILVGLCISPSDCECMYNHLYVFKYENLLCLIEKDWDGDLPGSHLHFYLYCCNSAT